MDIYCVKCGEPWEIDYLHDVADELGSTFNAVRQGFSRRGCEALGASHGDMGQIGATRALYASALFDLMGDDIDGIASELDDAMALGFLD